MNVTVEQRVVAWDRLVEFFDAASNRCKNVEQRLSEAKRLRGAISIYCVLLDTDFETVYSALEDDAVDRHERGV